MKTKIRLATISDLPVLEKVGDKLFDFPIIPERAIEFLNDPRHHLCLAFDNEDIIGMASAVHYIHPDKDPQLFVNEVSVLEEFQNKGIGRSLVKYLCEHGSAMGCNEAWVLTEGSNEAAKKTYLAADGTENKEPILMINFKCISEKGTR